VLLVKRYKSNFQDIHIAGIPDIHPLQLVFMTPERLQCIPDPDIVIGNADFGYLAGTEKIIYQVSKKTFSLN
jgi:hypothetical protein